MPSRDRRRLFPGYLLTGLSLCAVTASAQAPGPGSLPPAPANSTYLQREDAIRAHHEMQRAELEATSAWRHQDMLDRWLKEQGWSKEDLVFLPPAIPPFLGTSPESPGPVAPPPLHDYIGEPFFCAYGRTYYQAPPSPALWHAEKYVIDRNKLLRSLRELIEATDGKPEARRREQLADFCRSHEQALRKLETDAERARSQLRFSDDGTALAKLRDTRPDQSAASREYFTLVIAAQYQAGLSIDQRQMLEELAGDALAGRADDRAYFFPAGARVPWPDPLPVEVAPKLARFHELRSALKSELRRRVLEVPETLSKSGRTDRYRDLAAQHAPRFAELHALAETIRVDLADHPTPGVPGPAVFPPALLRSVGEAAENKRRLDRNIEQQLPRFSDALAPSQVKIVDVDGVPQLVVQPPADASAKPTRRHKAALKDLQAVNAELRKETASLVAKREDANRDLRQYHESFDPSQAPRFETLFDTVAKMHAEQEQWKRFKDYHLAVLGPGLTPGLRRIVFNSGLAELERRRTE